MTNREIGGYRPFRDFLHIHIRRAHPIPPSYTSLSPCSIIKLHHGERPRCSLQVGRPRRHRFLLGPILHLRCQRRHSRRNFRSSDRCQRHCRKRGHSFPHPLVAKVNHLRRPHQTSQYLHHHWQQRFTNGQLDIACAT